MARSGETTFEPNQAFFDSVLRNPKVDAIVDHAAERTLGAARAGAPVDTEAYVDGLHIEHRQSRYRRVARVVGRDWKTLLIESKIGNLARALKAGKR